MSFQECDDFSRHPRNPRGSRGSRRKGSGDLASLDVTTDVDLSKERAWMELEKSRARTKDFEAEVVESLGSDPPLRCQVLSDTTNRSLFEANFTSQPREQKPLRLQGLDRPQSSQELGSQFPSAGKYALSQQRHSFDGIAHRSASSYGFRPLRDHLSATCDRAATPPSLDSRHPSELSDAELLTTASRQISQLQKDLKQRDLLLYEKERHIRSQEIQIAELQRMVKGQEKALLANSESEKLTAIAERCHSYEKQVQEMEKVFKEHGLIWVGSPVEADAEAEAKALKQSLLPPADGTSVDGGPGFLLGKQGGTWRHADSYVHSSADEDEKSGEEELSVNYDLILKTVEHINCCTDVAKITPTMTGAVFKRPNATDLTLYKNGIMWKRGPFRRFADPGTKQCVVELMNGFFPQEQLDKDKKACPINVMDKRDTSFIPRTVHSFFPGEGKTVGDSGNPTKVTPASENAAAKPSGKVTSIPPGGLMTKEDLLAKLPASVIRKGKVIEIRSDVQKMFEGEDTDSGSSGPIIREASTQVVAQTQASDSPQEDGSSDATQSSMQNATLKVQTEDGKEVLVVKLPYSATIGDLRKAIDLNRSSPSSNRTYQICSSYPKRTYADTSATLAECGLTPSAKLHLAAMKRAE